ncbi:hypothetical protein ACWDHW_06145 [Streptomyces melanosporofaciens]
MTVCLLCERPYRDGYLCPGCARSTVERLARMGSLYAALAAYLAPVRRAGHGGRGRRAEAPLPVSERVLNLRGPGGIVGVLEDWRSALHADLGWSEPVPHGTVQERVTEAAARLTDNVLYVASSWPLAGEFAAEIRTLERDALSVVSPAEKKTRRLGRCPTLQTDGTRCGAVLRIAEGEKSARCPWCREEYPSDTWYSLVLTERQQPAA